MLNSAPPTAYNIGNKMPVQLKQNDVGDILGKRAKIWRTRIPVPYYKSYNITEVLISAEMTLNVSDLCNQIWILGKWIKFPENQKDGNTLHKNYISVLNCIPWWRRIFETCVHSICLCVSQKYTFIEKVTANTAFWCMYFLWTIDNWKWEYSMW